MANDISDLNQKSPEGGARNSQNVRRWMNTSRYVALMWLFAEEHDRRCGKKQPPRVPLKRRLTKQDREALLNAGLILLAIAVVAFIAGLM